MLLGMLLKLRKTPFEIRKNYISITNPEHLTILLIICMGADVSDCKGKLLWGSNWPLNFLTPLQCDIHIMLIKTHSVPCDRIKLFKTKQINSHALCIMQNIDHVYFLLNVSLVTIYNIAIVHFSSLFTLCYINPCVNNKNKQHFSLLNGKFI